jgi:EmrB/QacA subfamily drug resistance transporter
MSENLETPKRAEGTLSWLLLLALLVGPFLTMMDSSVVNVALPDIANTFNSSLTDVQWVLSGYLLSLAAVLVACAFLSKRFGASKVYLVSLIGFTLASASCALAPSLTVLIISRALQGGFGAPLVPLAMDILLGGQKSGERKIPVGFGIILFLAPALGPTIGGLMINSVGWPYVFLINVPIGLAAAALLLVNNSMKSLDMIDRRVSFDIIGSVMLAAGLVLTLYGSNEGASDGWTSMGSLPFLVAGILLIIAYVIWALVKPKPAVDLKLLKNVDTMLPLLISVVTSIILASGLFLMPVVMESIQGYSALDTGLALLPQGIVMGVGSVVGDYVYSRKLLSIRATVLIGMLLLTISTASLLLFNSSTSLWATALILSGRGFAIGLTIQPLLFDMMATLKSSELSDGNTLFNVMQRLGGSVGISALATLFQAQVTFYVQQALGPGISASSIKLGQSSSVLTSLPSVVKDKVMSASINGFHDTVMVLVGIALVGLVMALFLKNGPDSGIKASELKESEELMETVL